MQVVVITLGIKTWEVGFVIRSENGFIVAQRNPGEPFYSNYVLARFTPNAVNYFQVPQSPVKELKSDQPIS